MAGISRAYELPLAEVFCAANELNAAKFWSGIS
jgi:hypothetical protein